MAISASILFLFVFAAIEFSRMNMIRHTVDNAAYEGARRGLIMGATPADVRERADQLLDTLGVRGAEVDVVPDTITRETDTVTVTVTAPAAGNGFIAPHFFRGKSFTSECTLTRDAL